MVIKKKFGFTIAESLVCMLILGIVIGLAMKIFTLRHQKPMYNAVHGYFMCYRDAASGKVMQKTGAQAPKEAGTYCTFYPVKYANYYVLYAIGGGGGGGTSYGGSAGEFSTVFTTSIADTLYIYPGTAGEIGGDGGNTSILNPADEQILIVSGGYAGGKTSITSSDVMECQALPLPAILDASSFSVNTSDVPVCTAGSSGITASLCSESVYTSTDQSDLIKEFFEGFESNRAATKSSFPSQTYDKYYKYDSASNKLYYYANGIEGNRSNEDKYYDGNENRLYKYNTTYNSWFFDGVDVSGRTQSPVCISQTLSYSSISLSSDTDYGTYIKRASSSSNPYFGIIIKLSKNLSKINLSSSASNSEFVEYLENSELLNENTQVLDNSGRGGAKNNTGYAGAVMISW